MHLICGKSQKVKQLINRVEIKIKMKKVSWGILGCGDVTEIKSGPAFNKIEHSHIEAVMRRNAEKAADYSKRHHIGKWYQDANELINDDLINCIYIATPPDSHKDYTLQALNAGKNVYVEKPVALNSAQCKALIEAEKKSQNKVTVAHYRRAQPFFKKIKELIDQAEIGEVRFIDLKLFQKPDSENIAKTEENWRVNRKISGGGLFFDLAPHQLDILIYIFGKPVTYHGFSKNQSKQFEVPDITAGQIVFKNDIIFNGVWCFNSHPNHEIEQCEIIGSEGKIIFSFFNNRLALIKNGETQCFAFPPLAHVQQPMIEKTVKYFLDEAGENPCSLEDALLSLEVIENFQPQNLKP